MAKNPGRGNKIFRRNTIPNLVGQLTTTAQSTLTSLGFNSTVTNENTGDSNLNNTVKSQDIVGDAALGTNVSLVNYTFSFTPFGAFGFTPFGFTPEPPFGAFGFTPWSMVGCIEADTLIRTSSGATPAKNLEIGDFILTVDIQEIPVEGSSSSELDWRDISIETLTPLQLVETKITNVTEVEVQEVLWINNEDDKKYSLTQPVFIKTNNGYSVLEFGSLAVGDTLIKINLDGSTEEILIESLDTENLPHTVYQFSCEPQDWFIAGNYLVHNK
jgi:hypothetical protein